LSRWRWWFAKFHHVLGCFGLGLIFLQFSGFNELVLVIFVKVFEGVQNAGSRFVAISFFSGWFGKISMFAKFRSSFWGGVAKKVGCKVA